MQKISVFLTFLLTIVEVRLQGDMVYKPKPINPYSPSPLRWQLGLHSFFARELIIPHCIEHIPNVTCDIIYKKNIKIETGQDYDQFEIVGEPHVMWEADKDSLYLLYMMGFAEFYVFVDNGVVRNTMEDEWIQWLVHDIPGNKLHKGKVLYPYNEPRLPDPYLKNVYAIVIYKQNGTMNIDLPPLTRKGSHEFTSHKDFARKYNLGDPIAGNLFVYRFIPQESGEKTTVNTLNPNVFAGKNPPIPSYAVSFNPDYPDDPYKPRKTTIIKP